MCNTPLQILVTLNNNDTYLGLNLKCEQVSVRTVHLLSTVHQVGQLECWDHLKTCSLTYLSVDTDHQLVYRWAMARTLHVSFLSGLLRAWSPGSSGKWLKRDPGTKQIMFYSPGLEVTQHSICHILFVTVVTKPGPPSRGRKLALTFDRRNCQLICRYIIKPLYEVNFQLTQFGDSSQTNWADLGVSSQLITRKALGQVINVGAFLGKHKANHRGISFWNLLASGISESSNWPQGQLDTA